MTSRRKFIALSGTGLAMVLAGGNSRPADAADGKGSAGRAHLRSGGRAAGVLAGSRGREAGRKRSGAGLRGAGRRRGEIPETLMPVRGP